MRGERPTGPVLDLLLPRPLLTLAKRELFPHRPERLGRLRRVHPDLLPKLRQKGADVVERSNGRRTGCWCRVDGRVAWEMTRSEQDEDAAGDEGDVLVCQRTGC